MSESVAKNKRVIVLGIAAAIAVVGSLGYILLSSSPAPVVDTKPSLPTKVVPAPKKAAVPVVFAHAETSPVNLQQFVDKQLAVNPGMSAAQKDQLTHQLKDYQAFVDQQKNNTAYLKSIDAMSMNLHKLSLQSQIQQQALSIAKTNAEIAKSESAAMVAKEQLTLAAQKRQPLQSRVSLTTPEFVKLAMIYKQNGQYMAKLDIAGQSKWVKQGSSVDVAGDMAKVESLTASTVTLKSQKQQLVLDLNKAMETI